MNAVSPGAIDDVVHDVAAQIGMVNALHGPAFDREALADIVDHIANGVVVTGVVIGVVNAGSAAAAGSGNIVNVVSNNPDKGAIIQDSNPAIAADIESHDVDVIGGVQPHILRAGGADLRAPLGIR